MNEQNNDAGNSSAPDPIAQLKGETSRKLENVNSQLTELKQANALLLEKLIQMAPPPARKAAEPQEDLSTLMYSDPEKYTAVIEERATAKAEQRITANLSKQQEAQHRTQQALAEITNEYPELMDNSSALTKKALEIYQSMPEHERNSTAGYKLAVKEAASEVGVKPRSKRTGDEEFMAAGNNGSPRSNRQKANKVSPAMEFWAEQLGVDLSDSVVKDRVVSRAQRDFKKWQQPQPIAKKGKK